MICVHLRVSGAYREVSLFPNRRNPAELPVALVGGHFHGRVLLIAGQSPGEGHDCVITREFQLPTTRARIVEAPLRNEASRTLYVAAPSYCCGVFHWALVLLMRRGPKQLGNRLPIAYDEFACSALNLACLTVR